MTVTHLSWQRGREEGKSHRVWRRGCLGCQGSSQSWMRNDQSDQCVLYLCVSVFVCVFPHSLALVATRSRRERRTQKAWLIMVSTSEKGLRNSRSSLMVWIFLPTCRPAIWKDRRTDRRQNAVIFRLQLVQAPAKAPICTVRVSGGVSSVTVRPELCMHLAQMKCDSSFFSTSLTSVYYRESISCPVHVPLKSMTENKPKHNSEYQWVLLSQPVQSCHVFSSVWTRFLGESAYQDRLLDMIKLHDIYTWVSCLLDLHAFPDGRVTFNFHGDPLSLHFSLTVATCFCLWPTVAWLIRSCLFPWTEYNLTNHSVTKCVEIE